MVGLSHPSVFEEIAKKTRVRPQSNKPRMILLQGPPGTGKTYTARILSQQVSIPLVYVPLESVLTKWFGQSENNLAEIWELTKAMGKAIIFFDEIDSLASSRVDSNQASARVQSVLLRKLDGLESSADILLIAATNRKDRLDPAILSRIDLSLQFGLPSKQDRGAILRRYAKHLSEQENERIADLSEGLSGRAIYDMCKYAERKWGSQLVRKEQTQPAPTFAAYESALRAKRQSDRTL